ncbi:MAG: hypothetical protein AUH85_15375 [Chloroflexi bacterium 13_1_40CM_4_68_4]|nr:MAG: hypothetical protein AUH85_15375 [Chloroflexi bacterium 13_1_40CM_4_68_4]
MSLFLDAARWFTDPAHYQGSDAIQTRVLEHLGMSGLAVLVAIVLALPIGLFLGHDGRFGFVAVSVANVGRALPSLALLALALIVALPLGLGLGFWPTVVALIPLAIPPILTNAYVAVRNVDRDVVEAARGVGLGEADVLRSIELPLALPLVIAGVRTAAVNVVATTTLGAIVASGGLGRYIVDGFALQEYDRLFAGALLVAALAILVEAGLDAFEKAAISPGIRGPQTAL